MRSRLHPDAHAVTMQRMNYPPSLADVGHASAASEWSRADWASVARKPRSPSRSSPRPARSPAAGSLSRTTNSKEAD